MHNPASENSSIRQPQTQVQGLGSVLQNLVSVNDQLCAVKNRLEEINSKLFGVVPTEAPSNIEKHPADSVLSCAHFAVDNLFETASRLHVQLDRLENIL